MGQFGLISLGADYLLSEKAQLGLSFHYDRMTDPSDLDAELSGNGWLAGPYASLELGKGVFWDTRFFQHHRHAFLGRQIRHAPLAV